MDSKDYGTSQTYTHLLLNKLQELDLLIETIQPNFFKTSIL
jgi:hypothetical protein